MEMLAVLRGCRVGFTYHEEKGDEEDEVCQEYGRRPLGEGELLGLVGEAPVDVLPCSAKMLMNHFGWCCSDCDRKKATRFETRGRLE
jgi:hypothetical protein